MEEKIKKVAERFELVGTIKEIKRYGDGHIQETYLVTTEEKRYVLQKINKFVFQDVEKLMNNIILVNAFLEKYQKKHGGKYQRLVPTKEGSFYLHLENEYYRTFDFIEGATTYSVVQKPEHFYQSAIGFSTFQKALLDFDATKRYEVIKDFHNTRKRYDDFLQASKNDKLNRAKDVLDEIEFVKRREKYVDTVVDLLNSGELPLRVTHNDTKLNNVMLDIKTGKAVAVIDLDTLMPGSLLYDFGDAIRFGCNPVQEDEHDLEKVVFSLPLFETYARGFLSVLGDVITQKEKDLLAFSSILMTLECGMRFLSDYLEGDTYFSTHYKEQNLRRARTQFKLVRDMENNLEKMEEIINSFS